MGTNILQKMWEGPFWEGVWPCLDAWDSVRLRTASTCWNVSGMYGPHGELFFFLIKKELVASNEVPSNPFVSSETFKACALIGLHLVAAEDCDLPSPTSSPSPLHSPHSPPPPSPLPSPPPLSQNTTSIPPQARPFSNLPTSDPSPRTLTGAHLQTCTRCNLLTCTRSILVSAPTRGVHGSRSSSSSSSGSNRNQKDPTAQQPKTKPHLNPACHPASVCTVFGSMGNYVFRTSAVRNDAVLLL